jgi:signal transduction histidine kinase
VRHNISVRTELATLLPPTNGDRVQLQQVMMNLIVNAIEAMKDVDGIRDVILKSQRAENGQILVSVSDTGVGFPREMAERLFVAFFSTKPDGTGMGLRICRSIVESHGGRLWAVTLGAVQPFSLVCQLEALSRGRPRAAHTDISADLAAPAARDVHQLQSHARIAWFREPSD